MAYPRDFTDLSYPRGTADDYLGCPDLADRDAFCARIASDSMEPAFREGDIVVFSPSQAPTSGDACFVRLDDGSTTFKRVFFECGAGGGTVLRLEPINPKYRPQIVPAERVTGAWKAVYTYGRVNQPPAVEAPAVEKLGRRLGKTRRERPARLTRRRQRV
jgi:phage repressor protein C with HTH and peptisase S24 domain